MDECTFSCLSYGNTLPVLKPMSSFSKSRKALLPDEHDWIPHVQTDSTKHGAYVVVSKWSCGVRGAWHGNFDIHSSPLLMPTFFPFKSWVWNQKEIALNEDMKPPLWHWPPVGKWASSSLLLFLQYFLQSCFTGFFFSYSFGPPSTSGGVQTFYLYNFWGL